MLISAPERPSIGLMTAWLLNILVHDLGNLAISLYAFRRNHLLLPSTGAEFSILFRKLLGDCLLKEWNHHPTLRP